MKCVDINCDAGESYAAWTLGEEHAVLPHVSSVNISCGVHAGDPGVMRKTVELALAYELSIGAHPGLPDRESFGRRERTITPDEVYDLVVYQIGALQAIVQVQGARLRHVKPHGALYNMAAVRPALADAVARAVRDVDASLAVYGLSGSASIDAARAAGLTALSEVFPDRAYASDGTHRPRSEEAALIEDPGIAAARAVRMVREGVVIAVDGTPIPVTAETLCVHGDGNNAGAVAAAIRAALATEKVEVAAPRPRSSPG